MVRKGERVWEYEGKQKREGGREREACRGIRKKAGNVEEWDKKGSED